MDRVLIDGVKAEIFQRAVAVRFCHRGKTELRCIYDEQMPLAVGYNDQTNFSKAYKKHFGESPKKKSRRFADAEL